MTAMSAQSASAIDAANSFPEIDLPAIRGPDASPRRVRPSAPTARSYPSPRFGDYSRTRFESRVAFGGPDEGAEEVATPTRQFSLLELTSGLPDDSREADERDAERRLRDLRGRVKAAQAAVSATPGAETMLRQKWAKAAHLYAHFAIPETLFWHGVKPTDTEAGEDILDRSLAHRHGREEVREWNSATPPIASKPRRGPQEY